MTHLKSLLFCLFLLISGQATIAQETTAEISGKVTEMGAKVMDLATITAIHQPTNTKYTTTSRKDGRYNLNNLRIGGPYIITVSHVGFTEEKQTDVFLTIGQTFKADFNLSSNISTMDQVVVLTKSDKIFNKSRTGSSEVVNRTQIERLPTINRSINDFTRLTPTANSNATYGTSSFAGRSNSYNNLTVNGASFNNTFGLAAGLGGQTNSQPISIDALDQIQVNIAPYDITLGNFTGAGINSVTKSGTNEYKGTIYNYIKSPGLTGRRVGVTEIAKQDFNFSNRGVSVGGPIIKNKLFFFVSGEQERISTPATSIIASRNGSSGTGISQAKAEDLDLLANFLKDTFGYNAGAYENYTFDTYSDKLTARFDFNINSKHTLNVNYYYLKSYRNVPASNSGAPGNNRQPSTTAMPFFSSSYIINNDFNIVIAELNSRINNKLSNKLQIGFNSLRDYRTSPGGIFPLVDIENGAGQSLTSFGFEPFTAFNKLSTNTIQFNDVVTYHSGKHTFTFGTQNSINSFTNGFAPNYYGAYRFASLADFYNSVRTGAANASRYELRYSARANGEFPYAKVTATQLGFFAQAKSAFTENFTLTYGIRADIPMFKQNFIANKVADSLYFRDSIQIETGKAPNTALLISPRVGFNWDVANNKKTQVRGGLGIFAGAPPFVWISNQASNNGVDFGSFVRTSGTAFSSDINEYRPTAGAPNSSYNLAVTDRNFKFPQLFRSNIAIDQKLPMGITATLEAIFSKDINAVYHQNINLPNGGTALVGADNRIRYSGTKIYSGAGGTTLSNPNISDAILMKNSSKGSSYNITMQLQRNEKNLYTMLAYSYGKSKSVNDGGSIAQSIWRDRAVSGDPNSDVLSNSNFYQPHRVVAAAFYRFDYLKKKMATSFGFTFEAANSGTASYVYNGDVNNDGLTTNDLIYIPQNQSEIILEGVNSSDTRTEAILWAQLNNYINQDPYLSKNRGKYAERNGLLLPFYKRLDMNLTQDFNVKIQKKTNTIRLTLDIFNLGNLLNRNWGIAKITNRTTLLNFKRVESAGANAGKPVYSFPYFDAASQTPMVNTFQNSTGQGSRWQMQFGVRYIFN